MSCLSCENYIPLDPPIQRTDSHGQTYKVPGLCKIGADHIISGLGRWSYVTWIRAGLLGAGIIISLLSRPPLLLGRAVLLGDKQVIELESR